MPRCRVKRMRPSTFPRPAATSEGTVIHTELERDAILEALAKVAFSRPNDAIALALHPEKQTAKLDLWGVAEFKRGSGGVVEIKFTDRVKAISLLLEALGGGEDGMSALLEALEDCGGTGNGMEMSGMG